MTIWIVSIERHEQRYTGEWAAHLPRQVADAVATTGSSESVQVIEGETLHQRPTAGAFLDFAATNVFKAQQMAKIAELFSNGRIRAGDRVLFADAWHPGVISTRYMSDLLAVPIELFGLWHAGAYDEQDFLGRIPDNDWAREFERSLSTALDVNCFATSFHLELFQTKVRLGIRDGLLRTGWPMDYLPSVIDHVATHAKRNLVLFPHRLAPEKQVNIFRDLALAFPDFEFRVCQDRALSKPEYHRLLADSQLVFSASLQETLGIGMYEGLLAGAKILAPDRLSYSEMYPPDCLYPSDWTTDWYAYRTHKEELVSRIRKVLNYQSAPDVDCISRIGSAYFSAGPMMKLIVGGAA